MNFRKNGFRLYIPNSFQLNDCHRSIYTMAENQYLRAILKNNEDLFLADTANILTILLAERNYKYNTMTTADENRLIDAALVEYFPVMEATITADIEEHACAYSGRSNEHLYTLDIIETMIGEYESLVNRKYHKAQGYVISSLLEAMLDLHLNTNIPGIIDCVNKHNQEQSFPDLIMNVNTKYNAMLDITW